MKQKHLLKSLLLLIALIAGGSAWAATVTDKLTQSWTGVTGTSYTEWSDKKSNSDAVYAGQSAGGNNSIQLRSSNNNSGVITTTSGGKVKKIAVTWNSNTLNGRTLNVYGKNTAYSAATDLYNSSNQGTLLGTIVYGTSTELAVTADYEYIGFRSASGAMYLDQVDITWEVGSSDNRTATTVAIDDSDITNTNVYTGTAAGTLAATVMAGNVAVQGATVTWSSDNTGVATIDATTGAVTLVAAGTAVITATYEGDNTYQPSTATYTLTVTNNDPNAPGSVNNPYTVAQARAAIDANSGVTGVYATGIVSEIVTAYDSQYGNISYNISADGTTTADQLQAYRGKGKNGANFTSADDIQVGDVVVVYGNLKKYTKDGVDTYEFAQDNQLVSLQRAEKPATPTFSPAEGTFYEAQNVTISCETEGAVIYYTMEARYSNSNGEVYTGASVTENTLYSEPINIGWQGYIMTYIITAFAEKDGKKSDVAETTITIDLTKHVVVTPLDINLGIEGGTGTLSVSFINYPDYLSDTAGFHYWKRTDTGTQMIDNNIPEWFHIEYSEDYSTLTYTVDPNTTTEARDIEVEFWVQNTFSDMIHFTQEGIVLDYAELPFEWEGGASADFLALNGVTAEWLGSDYAAGNTPYLIKFDSDGDYIQVKTDGQPGKVTVAVKMIGGANPSKITVQESSDGETFTDVEELTISGAQNSVITLETTKDFDAATRYVRLLFTKGSNVGVGAITIEKPSTEPVIDVAETQVEATYAETEGTIGLTYHNIDITDVTDFDIQFYDAEGKETEEPDWIEVLVAEQDPEVGEGYVVSYYMVENEGEARTAYFKVFAAGDDDFVYSDLVTITQAKFVPDYATLPFNWEGGASAEFNALDGVTTSGLGNDYAENNAPYNIKFDTTGDYIQVKTDGQIFNVTLDVKMLGGASTSTITVQGSADGEEFADVQELEISGKQNDILNLETSNAFDANYRYVRLYFTKGSNVGVGAITINLVKKSISEAGYATYYSPCALDFTGSGLTAYIAQQDGNNVKFTQVETVPANTGVLLKGDEGSHDITVVEGGAAGAMENLFVGVLKNTPVEAPIFVLMNGEAGVGFYKTTQTFTVGAHTAYLPATAGARTFIGFDFDNTTTAIEGVANVENHNGEVYNLQGQRVSKAQKGLYIVGGKKVLVK